MILKSPLAVQHVGAFFIYSSFDLSIFRGLRGSIGLLYYAIFKLRNRYKTFYFFLIISMILFVTALPISKTELVIKFKILGNASVEKCFKVG